jgi:hypothetical protein
MDFQSSRRLFSGGTYPQKMDPFEGGRSMQRRDLHRISDTLELADAAVASAAEAKTSII